MLSENLHKYWNRIINTMHEGLIVIASDGTIVMVNQSFEQLTGYTTGDIIGKSCTILGCDACERVRKREKGYSWWCALFDPDHPGIKQCRCNLIKKDGAYMPALKSATVLRDEQGKPLGAVETITDVSELYRLDQEVAQLSRQLYSEDGFYGIIGTSSVMQQVFDIILKVGVSDAPVIIYGESGTGKELVANAIHWSGLRKDKAYVPFNCAALNESLLESELFGHAKGSFTGAYQHRIGRFEAANGGDIFLDEIGDIPLPIQVKLLRILDSKEFERVGEHKPIMTDVRIITATNKNLEHLVAQNKFREDLFFRINIIPIFLPPLRERLEDIPALVNTFIHRLMSKTGKNITGLSHETMDLFMKYKWPGNIRELKGALEYAFVIAEKGLILPEHLPQKVTMEPIAHEPVDSFVVPPLRNDILFQKKDELILALRQSNGNQSEAARILGINRVTVWNRIKKYNINLKKTISP
ncbi:MAG: sigma 54-interacting transcriptional regulator [Desulfobacterales bacterium]|nr:sigma 54-interacting transcriptional regulator [Desulfobacterales bacterium]